VETNEMFFQKIYSAHKSVFDEIFLAARGETPNGKLKVKDPDLTNLINKGIIELTDILYFRYKDTIYECNLIEEDGIIKIVYGGEIYPSVSTAIEKICNWHTNGWIRYRVKNLTGKEKGDLSELRKKAMS
jgi:hypothetical protein